MSRTRYSRPEPVGEPVTAAAIQLHPRRGLTTRDQRREVDIHLNGDASHDTDLAWYFYSRIPELRYIARYVANSLSQARLYVGRTTADPYNPERVESGPAVKVLENFAGGFEGQAELLDRLGLHLTITGDSVLVGPWDNRTTPKPPFNQFRVYSTNEIVSMNGVLYYRRGLGYRDEKLPDNVAAFRIWRPHPRTWERADSPTLSSFTVLREIDLLDQHVHASAVSRLAGAGLLVIPDEITFPADETETEGIEVDPFVKHLTEVMSIAIKNRESAAAMVPIMLRGPAEAIAAIQHLTFETPFSDSVPDLRNVALRRLALGMDVPPEVLLGMSESTQWCLDDETEVYTRNGWVSEPDIKIGDECLSLNHDTGMSEWSAVTNVYRADVVDEKMLSVEGSWHSSLTTLGHRWPVLKVHGRDKHWEREWATSAEILEKGTACAPSSQIPIKIQRAARLNELPTHPKYTDALVELVAWMFTEGSLEYRDGADFPKAISIYQSHRVNSSNCIRIRSALNSLYGPSKETILEYDARNPVGGVSNQSRGSHTPYWREIQEGTRTRFVLNQAAARPIVEHCPQRQVKFEFIDSLTYSQLRLFIEVAVLGDGYTKFTGHLLIGQKDPRMLDCIERAGILAGLGVNRYSCEHQGFHKHVQHYVSITPNRLEYRPRGKNIHEEAYTGRIWCPTVSTTRSVLARRNGNPFYTGNSAWQSDESTVRLHTIPLLQTIVNSITTGWFRPTLKKIRGISEEEANRLTIWFDVSNLSVRPNKTEDAEALYDRFQVGGDTLRITTGFTGAEKPTKKELEEQILFHLLRDSQALQPYAINALREKGLIDLPPAPESTGEVQGRPLEDQAVDSDNTLDLPGDRSRDKQTAPPPTPSAEGDDSGNEIGRP